MQVICNYKDPTCSFLQQISCACKSTSFHYPMQWSVCAQIKSQESVTLFYDQRIKYMNIYIYIYIQPSNCHGPCIFQIKSQSHSHYVQSTTPASAS